MTTQKLLQPYKLNDTLTLKNRIVMPPMTRVNADDDLTPTQAMADYYARRSAAGLIVSEGTVISTLALGQSKVPGIFTDKQINHWRTVTDQVHANNGLMFSQIWHVGRVSHPDLLHGTLPISASATTMTGKVPRSNGLMFGTARAATKDEIHSIINQYAKAATNARQANFDGVEIHGANGYLIDQFLHHHTNLRTDEFGGSPENMARFALAIVDACGQAIGYDRLALRLSPGAYLNEIIGDERDAAVFQYLLSELNNRGLAYIHTGSFNDTLLYKELGNASMSTFLRKHYQGTLIACGSYTVESASAGIENNNFDLVAFGRPFIANPDLVEKIKRDQPIQSYDLAMLSTLV